MILSAIRVNPLPSMLPFLLVILLYPFSSCLVFLLFVFVFFIFFFGFDFFLLFFKCLWPPSPLSHIISHRLSFASLLAHALCFASLPVSFRLFSFSALIFSFFISSIIKIIRFTVPCFVFFYISIFQSALMFRSPAMGAAFRSPAVSSITDWLSPSACEKKR